MSDPIQDELTLLKSRADKLGISYRSNISAETLKQKIDEFLAPKTSAVSDSDADSAAKSPETERQRRSRKIREAKQLQRVRITCMNPNKKSMQGEIFTVSNSLIGTVKRFVPFDAEDGWHVERILLQVIRARKYQTFYTVKDSRGRKVRRGKLVPEFGVEVLPALTQKDLDDLGKRQAMTGSISAED